MLAPLLPLAVLLACASTETSRDEADGSLLHSSVSSVSRPSAGEVTDTRCQYEGRYLKEGAVTRAREACLRCECRHGALSCRRAVCAPPRPPPPGCRLHHRRDACCPELYCPEGAVVTDTDIFSKVEEKDYPEIKDPISHVFPVCVEDGTAYAAGSAMSSSTACEQCFCLGGSRRCVRPRCLSPPAGCRALPAPGVCCPQRYYCDHASTKPPDERHSHDCKVDGQWTAEGERVAPPNGTSTCSQCFCLRGAVRCQSPACAPPLLGCQPLLEAGQCCPHQYQCVYQQRHGIPGSHVQSLLGNALGFVRNQDRSFRNVSPNDIYNATTILLSSVTDRTTTSVTVDKKDSVTTTKVKRKTSDPPTLAANHKLPDNVTLSTVRTTHKIIDSTTTKTPVATETTTTTYEATEQPEGSVKIIINGTINCTAELSSTAVTVDSTKVDVRETYVDIADVQPRIPNISPIFESQTYNPNDIITDRNYNEDFDDNESYTVNVTSSLISSLRTNTTVSTAAVRPAAAGATGAHNSSEQTQEYEYHYVKPTLPPSLPNLKIIPFVAADAVVDDDISSKESERYSMLEREDKYPVYYPSAEPKDIPFATRREDFYNPTQFPIFLSKKVDSPQYPLSRHEVELTNEYSGNSDIITSLHEYSATTSLGSNMPQVNKASTKLPSQSTKFEVETPAINLFSPPVETEGGFIPKDPTIIYDYYAMYSSTPAGSGLPHLTTSMQLDTTKECVSGDHRVLEGESISLRCSICTCAWGDLHCSQRQCPTPLGCRRRPADASYGDLCCGDLICNQGNTTTPTPPLLPTNVTLNTSEVPLRNNTEFITESIVLSNTTSRSDIMTTSQPKIPSYYTTTNKKTFESEVIKTNLESSPAKQIEPSNTTTLADDSEVYGNNSQEYDDEDVDEGFSLGSVLKLLLSDSYVTTTPTSVRQSTETVTRLLNIATKTTQVPTTREQAPNSTPTVAPVSQRLPFIPFKQHPTTKSPIINRIDHLMLGEATAIKTNTPRPAIAPFKTIATRMPVPIKLTTEKSSFSSKPAEITKTQSDFDQYVSIPHEHIRTSTLNSLGALGPGLLKLAGCNIYGKMYRVERIIAELSTPCQECRCTETGVQCRKINC